MGVILLPIVLLIVYSKSPCFQSHLKKVGDGNSPTSESEQAESSRTAAAHDKIHLNQNDAVRHQYENGNGTVPKHFDDDSKKGPFINDGEDDIRENPSPSVKVENQS